MSTASWRTNHWGTIARLMLRENSHRNPSMDQYVFLVRHGATEINLMAPPVLQGSGGDFPLCELGRWQAARVRDTLRDLRLCAIFSSPLRRAMETAQIIAEPHGLPVQPIPELREVDVGRWEGKSVREIAESEPDYYALFQKDPATHGYPEGESFADVERRVVPAMAGLFDRHPRGDFVVVWHNTVGRVYLAHLLGLGSSRAKRVVLSNGGISVLRRRHGQIEPLTINSCLHLFDRQLG